MIPKTKPCVECGTDIYAFSARDFGSVGRMMEGLIFSTCPKHTPKDECECR